MPAKVFDFQCPNDNTTLTLAEPRFDLVNTNRSIIAVAHNAEGVTCPACGRYYKLLAKAMRAPEWEVAEVEKPEDSPRIIVPGGR